MYFSYNRAKMKHKIEELGKTKALQIILRLKNDIELKFCIK